jgi:class 3 adenylate cyclase
MTAKDLPDCAKSSRAEDPDHREPGGDPGLALVEALAAIRVPIRVGIHSGEVALTAEHVRGVAVHAAARILGEARQGEGLVSGTTRDLAEGAAGLAFEPRGRYRLKGLEREHDLFAAASSTG